MKELQARVEALHKMAARRRSGKEGHDGLLRGRRRAQPEAFAESCRSESTREGGASGRRRQRQRERRYSRTSAARHRVLACREHATSDAAYTVAATGRNRGNWLRYDGRSFVEWLTQLDTELSVGKRRETIAALTAFGQRGYGPEVTQKLIELLADEDLREYAIRALGRLGPTAAEAIPAFRRSRQERPLPAGRGASLGADSRRENRYFATISRKPRSTGRAATPRGEADATIGGKEDRACAATRMTSSGCKKAWASQIGHAPANAIAAATIGDRQHFRSSATHRNFRTWKSRSTESNLISTLVRDPTAHEARPKKRYTRMRS